MARKFPLLEVISLSPEVHPQDNVGFPKFRRWKRLDSNKNDSPSKCITGKRNRSVESTLMASNLGLSSLYKILTIENAQVIHIL